ncbi:hypothetical protein VOLCADRAFT_105217 [Volvox carteri f. nagariensis]|uniref:Calcineurin-like phosphoesterase domain-containing protein n=1 Tax=Volvox carteri f. nagariensis TaxID=3068 RepID=D8TZD8_VOLCA|nr:uncharacterized protein VOLCADRAFT_105217 [Volvox carteri f. nagariensis]EFJ47257.1 hypothetical protein VOLCADRAFT_105217 [Volvox carteri f. nagariensis]|eukprot:XP_002951806.1 hypothetical protein VOLCADRAFT_105217 [Volvox carteri f. nagariensis]
MGSGGQDKPNARATLSALKQRFAVVLFCPGNHELWVTGKQRRPGESAAVATAAAVPSPPPACQQFPLDASPSVDACGDDVATGPKPMLQRPMFDLSPLAEHGTALPGVGAQSQDLNTHRQELAQPPAAIHQPLTQQQQPQQQQEPHLPVHDSLEKLAVVMEVCEQLGVWVTPVRLGRLVVLPLLAWHHKTFDTEPDIPGIPRASALTISDYARSIWPERILLELQAVRQQPEDRMAQQQQQQQQQEKMPPAAVAGAATAPASGPGAATRLDGSDRSGGAAALAADWRDGGHGSDAVAAWIDLLNEAPYGHRRGCSRRIASNGSSSTDRATSGSQYTESGASGHAAATDGGGLLDGTEGGRTATRETSTERNLVGRPGGFCGTGPSQDGSDMPQQRTSEGCGLPVQLEHQRTQLSPEQAVEEQIPSGGPEVLAGAGGKQGGAGGDDVISFSHFLPLQELLPEKRYLTFPNLAKAVGSRFLAERVRRLRPHLHLFGHTHFAWDAVHDGIRFVQAPLAYPSERRFRLRSLVMAAAAAAESPAAGEDGVREGGGGGEEACTGSAAAAATVNVSTARAENAAVTQGELSAERDDRLRDLQGPPPSAAATAAAGTVNHPPHPRDEQLRIQAAVNLRRPQKQNMGIATEVDRAEDGEQHPGQAQGQGQGQPGEARSPPWPSCVSEGGDVSWLPLCIYQAEYVVRLRNPEMDLRGVEGSGGGGGGFAAAVLMLRDLRGEEGNGGRSADGEFTASTAAVSGSAVSAALLALGGVEVPPEVEVLEWRSQWCPEQVAMWSSYYKRHPRRPHELQLAPWVAERYSRRLRRNIAKQVTLGHADTAPAAPPPQLPPSPTLAPATGSAAEGDTAANGNVGASPGASDGARGGTWLGKPTRKAACKDDNDDDDDSCQDCESGGRWAGSEGWDRDLEVVAAAVGGVVSNSRSSATDVEETELDRKNRIPVLVPPSPMCPERRLNPLPIGLGTNGAS